MNTQNKYLKLLFFLNSYERIKIVSSLVTKSAISSASQKKIVRSGTIIYCANENKSKTNYEISVKKKKNTFF